MGFRYRKTVRLGPVRLHFTEHGFSPYSVHFGFCTWNSRTRRSTVNTPGDGSCQFGGKPRGR